jgi:hypothetical protein
VCSVRFFNNILGGWARGTVNCPPFFPGTAVLYHISTRLDLEMDRGRLRRSQVLNGVPNHLGTLPTHF